MSVCPREVHEALKRDEPRFRALPHVGFQNDGLGGVLELRNCTCGSTLGAPKDQLDLADRLASAALALRAGELDLALREVGRSAELAERIRRHEADRIVDEKYEQELKQQENRRRARLGLVAV